MENNDTDNTVGQTYGNGRSGAKTEAIGKKRGKTNNKAKGD